MPQVGHQARVDRIDTGDPGPGPVTLDTCTEVRGPFLHGTAAVLAVGDELVAGRRSTFRPEQVMNHVYFTTVLETAAWGAELSSALTGTGGRGHVYVVEPRGPFEDDPHVTDEKFPGNPTRSYRTRDPLLVVGEVEEWEGHPPEVVAGMLAGLARLREQGLDVIEDQRGDAERPEAGPGLTPV